MLNLIPRYSKVLTNSSVHFPGAVNSRFTTELSFERPSTHSAIPTYRVMDSDGVIVDKARTPADNTEDEVLMWYRNMLTGPYFYGWKVGGKWVKKEG